MRPRTAYAVAAVVPVLAGLALSPAVGSAQADPAVEPASVLVLPVEGAPGVPARYVRRLQAAVSAALPAADTRRGPHCKAEPACLLARGQDAGVARVVSLQLSARGDDFRLRTLIFDTAAAAGLYDAVEEIAHRQLRQAGAGAAVLAVARAGDSEFTAPGPQTGAAEQAEGVPKPADAEGAAPTAEAAEAAEAAEDTPAAAGAAASVEAAESPAAAPDVDGDVDGDADGDAKDGDAWASVQRHSAARSPIGQDASWAERRRARFARQRLRDPRAAPASTGARAAAPSRQALLSFGLGAVAAGLGFLGAYLLTPQRRRVLRPRSAGPSPRHSTAELDPATLGLLRSCCKRMTPGILLSAESERVSHFCFRGLGARSLRIEVLSRDAQAVACLRPGATLCAQFVDGSQGRLCALTVLSSAPLDEDRYNVEVDLPVQVVDVESRQAFRVPVAADMELAVELVVSDAAGERRYDAALSNISLDGLSLTCDGAPRALVAGDTVSLSLCLPGESPVQVAGEIRRRARNRLGVMITPDAGGVPPHDFVELVGRCERRGPAVPGRRAGAAVDAFATTAEARG